MPDHAHIWIVADLALFPSMGQQQFLGECSECGETERRSGAEWQQISRPSSSPASSSERGEVPGPIMNRTCLTCIYLSEPDAPHKWHWCECVVEVPKCWALPIHRDSINIEAPFERCPTWEKREKPP